MVAYSQKSFSCRRFPTGSCYRGEPGALYPGVYRTRTTDWHPQLVTSRPGLGFAEDAIGNFVLSYVAKFMRCYFSPRAVLMVPATDLSRKIQRHLRTSTRHAELRAARAELAPHASGRLGSRWTAWAAAGPEPVRCTEEGCTNPARLSRRSSFYTQTNQLDCAFQCFSCNEGSCCGDCAAGTDVFFCSGCQLMVCVECFEADVPAVHGWARVGDEVYCDRCAADDEEDDMRPTLTPDEAARVVQGRLNYTIKAGDTVGTNDACAICLDKVPVEAGAVVAAFGCGKTETNTVGHWVCCACATTQLQQPGGMACVHCRTPIAVGAAGNRPPSVESGVADIPTGGAAEE